MFDNLRAGVRKRRRRKSMRPRSGSPRKPSRRRAIRLKPGVKIAAAVVVVLAIAAVVVFVFIKPFGGNKDSEEVVAEATATPTPTPVPLATLVDPSAAQELLIQYKSINDPYMNGGEVVFATDPDASAMLSKIGVFDVASGQTTLIDTIEKKYFSLFEPKISEDFIVYLDCKSEFGGAVCGYDRAKDETFVLREYLFGKPQVALVGNYALWLQQTYNNTHKIYLFDLVTKENAVVEAFNNPIFFVSAADMSEDALVYVQPYRQSELIGGTSSSADAELCIVPLKQNGDNERVLYSPGMFVYEPKIDGDYIVFLDGTGDENSNLMVCHKEGDTYSTPEAIATGVLNYDVGDGYVAYTLDDVVHCYFFEDGSHITLSDNNPKARLASANGKHVIWYDVTIGLDAETDVVMHITLP